jgi:hypothetical protein
MPRSSIPDPSLSVRLRHRLECAASELNPYLLLLAIGLALVNLTGFAIHAAHLKLSRGLPAESCAPAYTPQVIVSGADAALRAGS